MKKYKIVHKALMEDDLWYSYESRSALLVLKWMKTNNRATFMYKFYIDGVKVLESVFMQAAQDEAIEYLDKNSEE